MGAPIKPVSLKAKKRRGAKCGLVSRETTKNTRWHTHHARQQKTASLFSFYAETVPAATVDLCSDELTHLAHAQRLPTLPRALENILGDVVDDPALANSNWKWEPLTHGAEKYIEQKPRNMDTTTSSNGSTA